MHFGWLGAVGLSGFLVATPAHAGITLDGGASSAGTSGTTLTFSHTVGGGTNRLLVIGISHESGFTGGGEVTSVTYGGVALTQHNNMTGGDQAEVWWLRNPASGTANVVVTLSASESVIAGAISMSGANQTDATPIEASVSGSGLSISITPTFSGSALLSILADDGKSGDHTASLPLVEKWDLLGGAQTSGEYGSGGMVLNVTGGTTYTLSWTRTSTSPLNATHFAVAIKTDGQALATEDVTFDAAADGSDVALRWSAGPEPAAEVVELGILRAVGEDGPRPLARISADETSWPEGRFVDGGAEPGRSYSYWLELVREDGRESRVGPVNASAGDGGGCRVAPHRPPGALLGVLLVAASAVVIRGRRRRQSPVGGGGGGPSDGSRNAARFSA